MATNSVSCQGRKSKNCPITDSATFIESKYLYITWFGNEYGSPIR